MKKVAVTYNAMNEAWSVSNIAGYDENNEPVYESPTVVSNQIIPVIKEVRKLTGLGLLESNLLVQAVKRYWEDRAQAANA